MPKCITYAVVVRPRRRERERVGGLCNKQGRGIKHGPGMMMTTTTMTAMSVKRMRSIRAAFHVHWKRPFFPHPWMDESTLSSTYVHTSWGRLDLSSPSFQLHLTLLLAWEASFMVWLVWSHPQIFMWASTVVDLNSHCSACSGGSHSFNTVYYVRTWFVRR